MTTEAGAPGAAQDLLQRTINERFSTLLADPPLQFQNRTGKVAPEHRRLNRYATMTLNDIKTLPIGQVSADTAHLYLWVPNALLPEGLAVMMAWGFQYIFAALALYGIARHAFRSWRARPYFQGVEERMALVVALIWAVHPLNTQSVPYLYQRQESLMGMFYLLTLFSHTKLPDAQSAGRRGGLLWSAISVAACAAGLASKEVMITAPLVVLWYDRVFCARSWGDLLRRRGLYYLALSVTRGVLYWLMSRTWGVYVSVGILDCCRRASRCP